MFGMSVSSWFLVIIVFRGALELVGVNLKVTHFPDFGRTWSEHLRLQIC